MGFGDTLFDAIVSEGLKYIYWNAGPGGDYSPAEELYDIEDDAGELTNAAGLPNRAVDLDRMRQLYDQELTNWKESAVPYHDYRPFVEVFARK